MNTERQLALKLLTTYHLNLPERQSLPNGRARFSVLVEAVEQALNGSPWFPRSPESEGLLGDGAVIELRGDEYWIHESHEIGLSRYSPVRVYRAKNLADAVRRYIHAMGGHTNIDGVEIEWRQ